MELKDALKLKNKIIIGNNQILRNIRNSKIKEIFTSKNYPESALTELEKSAKVWDFNINKLKLNSEELGAQCRKPFPVAIIGILK